MDSVDPVAWVVLTLAFKTLEMGVPALMVGLACGLIMRGVSVGRGLLAGTIATALAVAVSFAAEIPIDLGWYDPQPWPIFIRGLPWRIPEWVGILTALVICCWRQRQTDVPPPAPEKEHAILEIQRLGRDGRWARLDDRGFPGGVTNLSVSEGKSGSLVLSWRNRYGEAETYGTGSGRTILLKIAELTGLPEGQLRIRPTTGTQP